MASVSTTTVPVHLPNDLQLDIVERIIELATSHYDIWYGAISDGIYGLNQQLTDYVAEEWFDNTEDHLKPEWLTAEILDEKFLCTISDIWEQTADETPDVEAGDIDPDDIDSDDEDEEYADEEERAENAAYKKFWYNVNEAFVDKMEKYRKALKENIRKNKTKKSKKDTPALSLEVVFYPKKMMTVKRSK